MNFDSINNITLTYNGEIYNFLELKKELSNDFEFITNSDTEVIIKSYLKWGENFLDKIEGMFAFALFDENEKKFFLLEIDWEKNHFFYFLILNIFLFFRINLVLLILKNR